MDVITRPPPVVYRIAHRVNYATVNLTNALARYQGFRAVHFLTHPLSAFVPERGFFSTSGGFELHDIPIENLREINRTLARATPFGSKGDNAAQVIWKADAPPPDYLIINQGSGISPRIMNLFTPRPKTIFYAECFTLTDFYPRAQWPMPDSMAQMNEDYQKRALAYADSCDAIVVPSRYAKSLWPAAYQSKIHVIFEGFDVEHLAPERVFGLSGYGRQVRSRFPGKKLVAYIGETIEPIRGFDAWIDTYRLLREQRDDVHFIVVSNDRIKYGEVGKDELNGVKSFKDWVLQGRGLKTEEMTDVTWLGTLPLYDYLSLLGELDVVIYPMYGMFANWSLFHALHMGAAVVASDRAYLPEAIKEGENGLLTDPDDPAAMAEKALALLRSDAMRMALRQRGRETVERRFSLRQTADKLADLMQTLY